MILNNHTDLCNAISTEKCSCQGGITAVTELRDENDRLRKANEELVKTLNNIITAVVHFKVKAEWCAEVADQVLKEVQEILNHSHESSESDK